MWMMITLVAFRFLALKHDHFHYESIQLTPEITKITGSSFEPRIFLILQRVWFDVDDDHTCCTLFFWHLNMIIFIMRLYLLFGKHLKLQKSQDLEFFWFFKESDLMWMMITLFAFCFSDTWTWLFSLWDFIYFSANTWNYKNCRI